MEPQASRGTRVAPHSTEAEVSVLGAMLLSVDAVNTAHELLQPDDFYVPAHQSVFQVTKKLFDDQQAVDAVTVSEGLRRLDLLDKVGGIDFLTGIVDAVPSTSNTEYYANIIKEHSLRRRLMRVANEIGQLATKTAEPIEEVVDQAERAVFAVSEDKLGDGLQAITPLLGQTLEEAEERQRLGSEVTGLSTGFRDLDRKLSGLHATNLVIIAARPGMGKSSLAFNIAQNVGIAGHSVALFTMEMSREEVVTRLMCSKARVDSQKLRTGKLTENDFTKLANAAGAFYDANIYVDDSPGLTVTAIRAKCRRLQRQYGLDMVVVDYLQLMNGSGQENRQQEIAMISRSLKSLARELHVPVVALSQLNRGVEAREDKRPRLGDLRESGAVEQDADVVMFIYRDEYYHPDKIESKGVAEVVVAKHRQGDVGKIDMTYLPEFTLFADMGRADAPM